MLSSRGTQKRVPLAKLLSPLRGEVHGANPQAWPAEDEPRDSSFCTSASHFSLSQGAQSVALLRRSALDGARKSLRAHSHRVRFQIFRHLAVVNVPHLAQDPSHCRLHVVALIIETV